MPKDTTDVEMLAEQPVVVPDKKGRQASRARVRSGLIAALDIGTTKVACLIARGDTGNGLRVIGTGHHVSRGLRNGTFVDLDSAESMIRATVEAAERMAGDNIRSVVVNVSAGSPRSRLVAVELSVAGHEIGDADIRRILDADSLAHNLPDDHEIMHLIPVGYSIDGCSGVRDPRGMFGHRLGVHLHVISASGSALRNLNACVARCDLDVGARVVSPYAAALGCLVEDEMSLGVTLIDMGGGTTSAAVFLDGEIVHTETVPLGGVHVSRDIARGLATPMPQAERIKTLYGSCLPSPSDDRHLIEVPTMGDDGEVSQVPRSMLVNIIRPRVEETFEMLRSRLEDSGFDRIAGRRVVLTGGASQLPGAVELAGVILDKQVRVGRPKRVNGLPEIFAGPAFATCAGLLRYASTHVAETISNTYRPTDEPTGRWGRFGQWLRENF